MNTEHVEFACAICNGSGMVEEMYQEFVSDPTFCGCAAGDAARSDYYADLESSNDALIAAERGMSMHVAGVVEYDHEATTDAIKCALDYGWSEKEAVQGYRDIACADCGQPVNGYAGATVDGAAICEACDPLALSKATSVCDTDRSFIECDGHVFRLGDEYTNTDGERLRIIGLQDTASNSIKYTVNGSGLYYGNVDVWVRCLGWFLTKSEAAAFVEESLAGVDSYDDVPF